MQPNHRKARFTAPHFRSSCALVGLTLLSAAGCGDQPLTQEKITADTSDTVPRTVDGQQVIHTQEGGRMEGQVKGGLRQGAWVSYFQHGGIQSRAIYVDGLQEGPTEVFHDNGMTFYTGQYTAGKPTGLWIFYDRNGDQERTARYDASGELLEQE